MFIPYFIFCENVVDAYPVSYTPGQVCDEHRPVYIFLGDNVQKAKGLYHFVICLHCRHYEYQELTELDIFHWQYGFIHFLGNYHKKQQTEISDLKTQKSELEDRLSQRRTGIYQISGMDIKFCGFPLKYFDLWMFCSQCDFFYPSYVCPKVKHILDICKSNMGVVYQHLRQNHTQRLYNYCTIKLSYMLYTSHISVNET